jgi:membrane protein
VHADAPLAPASSTRTISRAAPLDFGVFRAAYERLSRHAGNSLSGGLAFGALLSFAPLLIVVIGISSAVLGEGSAREEALALVRDSLGARVEPLVAQWIDQARAWSGGATVVGVALFLYGSARLVGLVDEAFELVFEVPPKDDTTFLKSVELYLTTQATSVAVTLGAGLVMVASLVLRAASASVFGEATDPGWSAAWSIARELLSVVLGAVAIAIVYRVLPPVKLARGDIVRGALVSAVLLELALLVLRLFAGHIDMGAAYGAAGAVVATLLTLYVIGQLFLFGAEVTAELAERRDGPPMKRLTEKRASCTTVRSEPTRA